MPDGRTKSVKPADISALKAAVTFLGPQLGFLASEVTARCLRVNLLGSWTSDQMLRYLFVQAAPLMQDYSRRMTKKRCPPHLENCHLDRFIQV